MDEWIKRLAEDYASEVEIPNTPESTRLSLVVASPEVDVRRMFKLLSSNGFPIVDISVSNTEDPVPPTFKEGDRVVTTAAMDVGSNITIKTPAMLYTIDKATLPAGYIGEVKASNEKTATVVFDANIRVEATDRSGYLDTVDYYVEEVEVPLGSLKTI